MDILEVKKLNKYFGKKQVLKDINFSLSKGEIVGLVGANGAGKTTIMKSILSLITFKGEVLINGVHSTFNEHFPLENVGALIENPGLYPYLTGRDHLKLFATGNNVDDKVENIINKLNLSNYIDTKTKKYSLGMKQKLGLGLSLLNNPKLVILDEPMNGLDPQATKELREAILEEASRGTTFLISSHILGELQKIAKKIILISDGEITNQTTVAELLEQGSIYYTLTTSNDAEAIEVLKIKGYKLLSEFPLQIKLEKNTPMGTIIKELSLKNIDVINMEKHVDDLEDSILNAISNKQGARK